MKPSWMLALIPLVLGALERGGLVQAETTRPNFVFLYTDDQRWDALGVVQREQGEKGRFPWLESPNLDELAAEGTRFRNAFVVTALCAPSRASFLTGRYGHLNGVVNNHTSFSETSVTHASLMRAAGYRTAYVGKWHMGNQSGQRPGFDYSASFIGQGVYFDCPVEVNGVKTATKGWIDDVSTEYAIQFLEQNKDRPFSLVLGFKTCHGPFTPPPRAESTYGDAQARVVPNLEAPAIYRGDALGKSTRKGSVDTKAATVKTNLGMFRGLRAIDENVGKLMATLDRLGLTENTVVVYSSDNGYYLGEHGLGDKRSAYDESLRVPMLLRYPKLKAKGKVIDQMVLNIDLAPTWLDLAGLPIPQEMQGRSWKPLLTGDRATPAWRESFFYSYFRETPFQVPTLTALRTEQAKLIRYPGHDEWTEVFDLVADPYETKNLANDSRFAELRRSLESEYSRQRQAVGYLVPEFADEKQPQPKQRPASPSNPVRDGWVVDYRFDQDTADRVVDASSRENRGVAHGVPLTSGRDGAKARQFDGQGHIEIPKSISLNPTGRALTIEATLRATGDGVVIAQGGESLGFLLAIKDGKPTWSYRSRSGLTTVQLNQSVIGEWVTLKALATSDKKLRLEQAKLEVESGLPELIHRMPFDGLEVGADLRSQVLGKESPRFRGQIERIRIGVGRVE